MRKIKLEIAYDGRNYAGWQRQKNAVTVQAVLEDGLSILTGAYSPVHSAGRTDTGVHAEAMPLHFSTSSSIPIKAFKKGLNSILPEDIRALRADEVAPDFHARYDAVGKEYHYYFSNAEIMPPTRRFYCAHVPRALNIERMDSCLKLLVGRHDFSSFEAAGSRDHARAGKGAIREIFAIDLVKCRAPEYEYRVAIYGEGFLRKMVRNIMGTLFEAGRDKLTPAAFQEVLEAGNRNLAGPTASACGLFLHKVYY